MIENSEYSDKRSNMSNKLVKDKKEPKHILSDKQKKIAYFLCLTVLCIAFAGVWIHIFLTTKAFNKQMEEMVLGNDYFMEEVVITDNRSESVESDNTISKNYFFYYQNGKKYEYQKRMQVSGDVYSEYHIGDTVMAYTTDHVKYSYYKYGILPDNEFRNNELMKVAGVLLGTAICTMLLLGVLCNKIHIAKNSL